MKKLIAFSGKINSNKIFTFNRKGIINFFKWSAEKQTEKPIGKQANDSLNHKRFENSETVGKNVSGDFAKDLSSINKKFVNNLNNSKEFDKIKNELNQNASSIKNKNGGIRIENLSNSKAEDFKKNLNSNFPINKPGDKMEQFIEENTGIRLPHYSDPLIDIQINQKITFEKLILEINECLERLDDFENKFFELLTIKEISSKLIEKFYKNHLDFSIIKVYVFFLKRQLNLVYILTQIKFAAEEDKDKMDGLQKFLDLHYRCLLDENNPEEKIKFKNQLNENLENLHNITRKVIEKYQAKKDLKKSKSFEAGKLIGSMLNTNRNDGNDKAIDDFNKDVAADVHKKEFRSADKEQFEFRFKDEKNKKINIEPDYFDKKNLKNLKNNDSNNNSNLSFQNKENSEEDACGGSEQNINIFGANLVNENNGNSNSNSNSNTNTNKNFPKNSEIKYSNSDTENKKDLCYSLNPNILRKKQNESNLPTNLLNNLENQENKNIENNPNQIFLENNLSLININQETIVNWLAEGDLRLDENINKMLNLEKIILEFYDSAENQSFKPSLTSVGVTVKIMSINTQKAIKLISELSQLKKIRSEELTINFLTICNKFELFANFFLLSCKTPENDLFNLPENSPEWLLIKSKLDKKILFSRSSLNKKLEKVFSMITVGMASVSKGFKNKNNSLVNKVIQTGIYMPYFFLFRKNADIQTQKFAINPDFDVALLIWNMMDVKYVKNIIKMTMPNIKHSKKYFLKKEEKEELTPEKLMEDYKEFLQIVKGDKAAEQVEFRGNQRFEEFRKDMKSADKFGIFMEDEAEGRISFKKQKEMDEELLERINVDKDEVIISNDELMHNAGKMPQMNTFFERKSIEFNSSHEENDKNNINNLNDDCKNNGLIEENEIKIRTKNPNKSNNNSIGNCTPIEVEKSNCCCGSPKKKHPCNINNNQNTTQTKAENATSKSPSSFKKKSSNQNIIEENLNTLHLQNYVKVRFISSQNFIVPQHQSFWSKIVAKKDHNNSPRESLIIHIHGGGFIAMSSSSHEMYTRKWAKITDVPIMSIDYRLAPDNPYPKALDDVYQSYLWILKYAEDKMLMKLKNIILVGDSAGGNLVAALTNLLVARGQRLPTAIFLIYPALRVSMTAFSLSMLNVIDDKILPYHLVKFCLEAYRKDYSIENDPFISPIFADDEMLRRYPPVRIYVGTNDPLRDDSFLFMKKLLNLNKDVKLTEYTYFPHGFMNFDTSMMMPEVSVITEQIAKDFESFCK